MANKTWPFILPANYIYDPGKIEIADGLAKLRKSSWANVYANWRLNESSGAIAADSSGNGRHGSLINMEETDWKAGKLNNCLEFDGVNECINFGDIANFERTDAFSLELWLKTGHSGDMDILNRMMAAQPFTGWIIYMSAGAIQVFLANSISGANYIQINVNENFADNLWHHLIITYDGSSLAAGVHIYIDGNEKILLVVRDALSASIQNAEDCRIAARDRPTHHFEGQVDEVVIYDKELTPGEVAARWNSGNGIEETPGDAYPTDKPTIRPSSSWHSFGMTELTQFIELTSPDNQGNIRYQLSEDDGSIWRYWDGAAWSVAGEGDYNDLTTVQANIGDLSINEDKIIFKAFLISDGTQKVELASIGIFAARILDFLQATDRKIQDIKNVEIGEWKIENHILYFLDPTGQETIASFQLHYDTKGNVIRRERIS